MNLQTTLRPYVCLLAFGILAPCRLALADVITIEWNPSSASTVGYKLHVGTQSGSYTQHFDVGPATTFTYTNAVAGQHYCFAVSAYSSPAFEGPTSNEVCGYSNTPPVLTNPGNQSSTVGQRTTLQLGATDPEGQAITYSQTGLPPGLTLQESTGFISGSGTTAGSYGVQVTASDGVLTSSHSFTWAMSLSTTPTTPSTPDTVVTLSVESLDRQTTDQVRLSWTDAPWKQVWVYRNGTQIGQVTNNVFSENIRASGTYTYEVCAPNATACSNSVTVNF
jgi:putative Ig domain-containing protein